MGPESQEEIELDAPVGALPDQLSKLEGATLNSKASIDESSQSAASPQTWAAKPVVQKEKLNLDELKIFIVLALMTAAMAMAMKFLF
jgi:hypothetical protein